MSTELQPTQVVRGMALETAAVRLRARALQPSEAEPTPGLVAYERELQHAREQALRDAREQGLRSGREEGLRQGRSEAAAEVRAAVEKAVTEALRPVESEHARLRELANTLEATVERALAAAQDELAALCFETICRMLGEHAVRPTAVRGQIEHLLALHGPRERVVAHVHPQDAQLLAAQAPELRCEPDPQVSLGGCILRSPAGGLDARFESMLEACRDALLQVRSRGADGNTNAGGAA